ncbi:MAG: hypothetical protein RR356_05675 [Bacteroidales bacterium]
MKNKFYFLALLIPFLLISCNKEQSKQDLTSKYDNTATPIEGKEASSYFLQAKAGHPAKNCKGCVTVRGRSFHVNCQGPGEDCVVNTSAVVSATATPGVYQAIVEGADLTSEDFYNMPDRSFFIDINENKEELWLNIPAQLVERNTVTKQFTFNNLFYSNSQVYKNN